MARLTPSEFIEQQFPEERGRVLGYARSKGIGMICSIDEYGTNPGYHNKTWSDLSLSSKTDVALMPDQIEDFSLYRGLQRRAEAKGIHDFVRVIVQSGLLEEQGVTF